MRPIVTDQVSWFVCRSVCLSLTVVSPVKTAEPIEMPLGYGLCMGLRNHVLGGGLDPHGANLKGKGAAHCKA